MERPMPDVQPTSATMGPEPGVWREVLLRSMSERETMVVSVGWSVVSGTGVLLIRPAGVGWVLRTGVRWMSAPVQTIGSIYESFPW